MGVIFYRVCGWYNHYHWHGISVNKMRAMHNKLQFLPLRHVSVAPKQGVSCAWSARKV